jgi:hypothetical protein
MGGELGKPFLDELLMQSEEFGLLFPISKTPAVAEVVYVGKTMITCHKLVYLKIVPAFTR